MINKKVVQYIAVLARVDLPEDKLQVLTKNLMDIVRYVEQLQKLDLKHVKPTSHAVPLTDALRQDIVRPSLSKMEALSLAPQTKDDYFKVPLVIE